MQRFSYPRTYHLPWSPGATSDDKRIPSADIFVGKKVIATKKRDGENTTLYRDGYVHARSIDGTGKDYQSWIVKMWIEKCYLIEDERDLHICGENLFAKHSIEYKDLSSYFEMFGLYDSDNCLSWSETTRFAETLGLTMVPVVYEGIWDEKIIRKLCNEVVEEGEEGIVVRVADQFPTSDFCKNVAKYVRANHVTTDQHWTKSWTKNSLRKDL